MERALLTTAEELTIAEETTSSFESTLETTVETPREPRAYLVPVAHLTSRRESVSLEELSRVRELAVPRELRGPLEERLGGVDLEPLDSPEGVLDLVSQDPGAIGLVPWEDVDPRVKALAVNGVHPLRPGAEVPENYPLDLGEADGPDSGKLRRVVIGGDMVLDRGLHHAVFQQGRGIDFPLDGGRAAVTWRASEPSEYSEFGEIHQFRAERRGEPGAVREYLNGADLALANLESPVLANATYHPEGTTFHGDLGLLPILADAGIDGVTLANNHVLDAGEAGLAETMLHLDDAGIAHAGAGMDLASAREPMVFDLGGVKVGVLNYQNVPSYEWAWATEGTAGTAPLREDVLREDIRRLESRVDTVIVMPHWGEEYTATPEPEQVELARSAVDAGADLVAGGHAHWAKGIEVYEGAPVFYGVGNFLFDQVWSEETSTGIFAEVTLYEDRVIQTKPVPFIVLDYGQPNFLLPNGGGKRALNTIFSASLGSEFDGEE
ncbi:MAG: CapA family protein [Rubrobacteraceae bacterium]